MARSGVPLLAFALFGCTKAVPSPEPSEPPAPSVTASVRTLPSSGGPRAIATTAPLLSAAAPVTSDASPSDGGLHAACTFELKTPERSLAQVPSSVVAHAIVPSLDTATMKAKVVKGEGGKKVVLNCRGGAADAEWDDGTRSPGSIHVLGRQNVGDGREAVWLATASGVGMGAPDSYGFFAIVAKEGPRLAVLGVSPWTPGREWDKKVRTEHLGDETVYVELGGFMSEMGGEDHESVWTLRDGELHVAGMYPTKQDQHPFSGDEFPDDAGFYEGESFTATAQYAGKEIVLRGESNWKRRLTVDAGTGRPWGVGRRASWVRRFALRDGKLVETGPKSRWGHAIE